MDLEEDWMKLKEWAGYKSQRALNRHVTSLAFINGVVWKVLMGNMGLDLTQFYKITLRVVWEMHGVYTGAATSRGVTRFSLWSKWLGTRWSRWRLLRQCLEVVSLTSDSGTGSGRET